jgi:hypothetical protein
VQAVRHWRDVSASIVALRGRMEHFAQQRRAAALRTGLSAWRSFSTESRTDAAAVRHARKGLARLAFRVWRRYVARQRNAARIAKGVRSKAIGAAWQTWRVALQEARVRRMVEAREARTRSAVFHAWSDRATILGEVRRRGEIARTRDLRKRVLFWREWAAEHRAKRERTEAAAAAIRRGIAGRILGSWRVWAAASRKYRDAVREEQEMRTSLERRLERTRLASLRVIFDLWKTRVLVTRRCRNLSMRFIMGGRVRRLFDAWKEYAQVRHAKRIAAEDIVRRYQQRAIRRAFWGLREAVLMRKASAHAYKTLLKKVFRAWKMATRAWLIAEEEAASVALAHHERMMHRRVFLRWQAYASHRAFVRRTLVEAESSFRAKHIREALSTWLTYCRVLEHERVLLRRAKNFFDRRLVAQTFAAWRGLCFSRKHASALDGTSMSMGGGGSGGVVGEAFVRSAVSLTGSGPRSSSNAAATARTAASATPARSAEEAQLRDSLSSFGIGRSVPSKSSSSGSSKRAIGGSDAAGHWARSDGDAGTLRERLALLNAPEPDRDGEDRAWKDVPRTAAVAARDPSRRPPRSYVGGSGSGSGSGGGGGSAGQSNSSSRAATPAMAQPQAGYPRGNAGADEAAYGRRRSVDPSRLPDVETATPRSAVRPIARAPRRGDDGEKEQEGEGDSEGDERADAALATPASRGAPTGRRPSVSNTLSQRILDTFAVKRG